MRELGKLSLRSVVPRADYSRATIANRTPSMVLRLEGHVPDRRQPLGSSGLARPLSSSDSGKVAGKVLGGGEAGAHLS